jgi:hypothetical protein
VELCNTIAQAPIQGIEAALRMIDGINQNHMNETQRIHYRDFDDIDEDEGVTITILPLLIQATVPSFHLIILEEYGDVV